MISIESKPLVTFAIFCFNQEKYIKGAIESALAQDYERIEIIVSDDGSSDATFEIAVATCAEYKGHKSVIVRKTSENRGTFLHVVEVARIAKGKLLVLSAGDDLSKPQRTTVLVKNWIESGAWGLCSRFDRIDENGSIIGLNETVTLLSSPHYALRKYFKKNQKSASIIHGASSAYDVRLFDYIETNSDDYILSEDGTLSVLLNLIGRPVKILDESLISYRESQASLTNATSTVRTSYSKAVKEERAIERFARSQANRCRLFLRLNAQYGPGNEYELDTDFLGKEILRLDLVASWRSLKLRNKLDYLANGSGRRDLSWFIPRLLPESVFLFVKVVVKNTKLLVSRVLKGFTHD